MRMFQSTAVPEARRYGAEDAILGAVAFARQAPSIALRMSRGGQEGAAYSDWCDWDNSGGHNDWEDQSSGPPGGSK